MAREQGLATEAYPRVRVAAVQAAPVFLDREATTRKACDLILEAGAQGARFIVFPECFIPGYPYWFDYYPARHALCQRCNHALFANSVEVPSPTTDQLAAAARQAQAYVVVGINERRPEIMGTMYNSQLFIGPDGRVLGNRRKVMPTGTERLLHGMGDGTSLTVFPTDLGPISGLICGENGNPLFKFALAAQGERLHAASWPAKTSHAFATGIENMVLRARACSMEGNHFGVHAAGVFSQQMMDVLELTPEVRQGLLPGGGSCVTGPTGELIAGPAGGEEMILYADVDLADIVTAKLRQDFTGHYNRFDVVGLTLNTTANPPLRFVPGSVGAPAITEAPTSADLAATTDGR